MSQAETQSAQLLKHLGGEVVEVEHRVLDAIKRIPHLKHDHPPVRDVNKEYAENLSLLDRAAVYITEHVGSFGFFLIIGVWSVVWLLWNTFAPKGVRFDPAPAFVLWLFISNLLQIALMPLIMVGQNLQSRHSELRAASDYEVNVKAEKEIGAILLHLEHMAAQLERQGEIVLSIAQQLKGETAASPAPASHVGAPASNPAA
jgi:uncharacterized membrane protein